MSGSMTYLLERSVRGLITIHPDTGGQIISENSIPKCFEKNTKKTCISQLQGIYVCYTDSEPNRSTVRITVERNFFENTTWLLLHLLSACHNLGDGMPYDNTSLLGLLLRQTSSNTYLDRRLRLPAFVARCTA